MEKVTAVGPGPPEGGQDDESSKTETEGLFEEESRWTSLLLQEASAGPLVGAERQQLFAKYRKRFLRQVKHRIIFKESTFRKSVQTEAARWHREDF